MKPAAALRRIMARPDCTLAVSAHDPLLAHLKEHGSSIGIKDRLATVDEYFSAVDLDRYLEMEQEIMRPYASSKSIALDGSAE